MFNFLRRLLPDFICADPSVADLIASFEETKRQLVIQQERYVMKADEQRALAAAAQSQARAFTEEAARAARVVGKIEALTA